MSDPITDTAAVAAAHGLSPVDLFLNADIVVKTVISLLVLASAWSWIVIADKLAKLQALHRRAGKLIKSVQQGLPINALASTFALAPQTDPFVIVYKAMVEEHERSADLVYTEAQRDALQERIHRVAQLASAHELDALQTRLAGLATIGAVSPFVGLFGTVWGIMTSFQGIATSNNTSLAAVAPGIAEALFATALGLIAAIPAVIFYNRIGSEISRYGKRLTAFIGVFEIETSRQFSNKGDRSGLRVA